MQLQYGKPVSHDESECAAIRWQCIRILGEIIRSVEVLQAPFQWLAIARNGSLASKSNNRSLHPALKRFVDSNLGHPVTLDRVLSLSDATRGASIEIAVQQAHQTRSAQRRNPAAAIVWCFLSRLS